MDIKAQDIQFSMFYSVPLYINPAFAGSRHANRAMMHYRWQWNNQPGRYYTGLLSFDTYSTKYKSGIGAMVIRDYQGGNQVISTHFSAMYAYEVRLNSNHTMRFGLQGGFINKELNASDVPSDYTNDGRTGFGSSIIRGIIVPDISAGILYYAKRLYASLSMHHLNRPNESIINQYAPLPTKLTITAGYKIPLVLNPVETGLHTGNPTMMALTPTFTYKKQMGSDVEYVKGGGSGDQLDIGIYYTYKWLISGLWYRGLPLVKQYQNFPNNESVVFLVGASYLGFGFGYAYDLTISSQQIKTGGAHEINLSYVFRTKHTKKPIHSLPCPDFEYEILQRGSAGRVK